MTDIVNCPHCGITLGVSTLEKCPRCKKRISDLPRPRAEPKAGWWFRFRNGGFRRACAAGRGHLVEARIVGSGESAVANRLVSVVQLHSSPPVDGPPAWERFLDRFRKVLFQVRCPPCGRVYAVSVDHVPFDAARGYIVGWRTGWCEAYLAGYGEARMRCPGCDVTGRADLRILNGSRFQGRDIL